MGPLTAAQEAVAGHGEGLFTLTGGPGTGKTTALRERWIRLAADGDAGRILMVCRSRAAADRLREALLPKLRGGFGALPVTTVWGLAFDAVQRAGLVSRLLSGPEQCELVARLLAAEARQGGKWPTLDGYVDRPAFAEEVAAVLLDLQADRADPAAVRAAGAEAGVADRWDELLAFAERYRAHLAEHGWIDGAGVLAVAADLDWGDRFAHALIDDVDALPSLAAADLVAGIIASVDSAVVTSDPAADLDAHLARVCRGNDLRFPQVIASAKLDRPFRVEGSGTLLRCHHPAVEAEAVAAELRAAHDGGLAWDQMAVLTRSPATRGQAVARALARHGIPATAPAARVGDEPALRGLIDLLAWSQGDDAAIDRLLASPVADLDPATVRAVRRQARADDAPLVAQPELARLVAARAELQALGPVGPVELAHAAFRTGLVHLVHGPDQPAAAADDRALDAVVAWLGALGDEGRPLDDPWVATPQLPDRVTVTSIDAAAGHEWALVVLVGCLEGELPRVRTGRRFFDRPLLRQPVLTVPERRMRSLAEEQRLFAAARSRAVDRFVAMAAPEPGVALSRFVGGWSEAPTTLPVDSTPAPAPLPPTAGSAPVWPEGVLQLSATQLDTYADCPLRYAYRYALGVRDESSVYADLGSAVHDVLERFLDPERNEPRTLDRLLEIADECWRDDIARFRPQQEEARHDYMEMLARWWEKEGSLGDMGPEVLATERAFTIAVGPHTVQGRIDRIDRADDGLGIRVLDYKTGKSMLRQDAMADDLQLATYHLAATRDTELATWGPPTQLRLLYLRRMETREQEVRPDHAELTEGRILTAAGDILAEAFEPSAHADCDHCDFHRLCPLWDEGREVGEK